MIKRFDEQAIYDVLSGALLAGRLAPGARLGEQALARLFGVTRERVRKVLHRLGHDRLIELIANRGAFVAAPTLEDARRLYEARRIVEGGLAARLAERLTVGQIEAVRDHLRREEQAHARGDRAESIRLSGRFHTLLAEMSGNDFVRRHLQELVSRTAMLVAFFEAEAASDCGCDEHAAIVGALSRHDPAAALQAMVVHLSLVETRLQPLPLRAPGADVEVTLRAAIRDHGRGGKPVHGRTPLGDRRPAGRSRG